MLEQERDLVVFADNEGNEITLEVRDYFYYNGQEYAVLSDVEDENEDSENLGADDDLYIMKVVPVGEDQEEFVPVEDELLGKLVEIVQTRFDEMDEDEPLE